MTLLSFTNCCLLLGVDPKTLRLWLTSAHLSCTIHPTDARLKCLTPSQLHHLAELHGRFLPDPLPGEACGLGSSPTFASPPAQASSPQDHPPGAPAPEADLRHQITLLQAQVASLQEHVTQLALALVHQQQWHWEQHASPAPTSSPAPMDHTAPSPAPTDHTAPSPGRVTAPAKPSALAEPNRPRSRALPLIEQGADGRCVVISPTQGVLPLVPDSPEWFDWLSSLNAFTFQSERGRFSATRKFRHGQRIQSWNIHRSLHGRSCTLYLGLTPTLTLARLQDMATAVQARLTAL
jgi:hypothetical protein